MNILFDYNKIKWEFDPSSQMGRNRKNNYIKNHSLFSQVQDLFKSKYFLPKINNYHSLNVTKSFSHNKKILSQRSKFPKRFDILSNFEKKDKNNIISLKDFYLFKKPKDKLKLNLIDNNCFNNKKDIKAKSYDIKKLKIKNIIYNAENIGNKNENDSKREDNKLNLNINKNKNEVKEEKEKNTKKNSMFMTEINFLINNKKGKANKMKIENLINKKNKNLEKQIEKKNDYDSMNFKELIKHIEKTKRRIIYNQKDINNMLKTTRDTFQEIWKINHQ